MSSEDESDDMEWEEIVPVAEEQTKTVTLPSTSNVPFEITIKAPPPKASDAELRKQKAQADALRRIIRLTSHRLHTIALLVNASIRNKWAKGELLHARLMSLTPLPIQTSFSMITKRAQPDKTVRGRQFEAALVRLAEWWATTFRVDSNLGIRHQTFELGSSILQSLEPVSAADPKGKGKAKVRPKDEEGEDVEAYDFSSLKYGERIRTVNSMMKHALMMRGSPDLSAQLFTALCRALDLPARLVVSLQPVLWRREKTDKEKAVDRAIQKSRKVAKEKEELIREATMIAAMSRSASGKPRTLVADSPADASSPIPSSSKGKGRAIEPDLPSSDTSPGPSKRTINLRKTRPTGRTLASAPVVKADKKDSAPVFWTEVYSRPDGRWLPVNPITGLVDRNRGFEPVQGDKFNHMMYVVAFEEDGFIKDVTPRYAKNYVTKVLKERSTNERPDWWSLVLSFMTRTYRLHRDDVEEAEFDAFQVIEGMPTSVGAFKNHPLYALERHLRQDEVIYPKTEIGKFRGEPVYARHSVTPLKSAENWLRTSGRTVKEGEQSLRYGKIKAATINKRRAIEMAAAESAAAGETQSESSLTQGLYARWQTEAFIPEPVVDGKVPKNEFGNIDLYTPSMLPAGAAHVPFKGTAKIARQLGIDYAEAVTGFEFRQRRAFPIINGIVVPTEHAQTITEAYEASAQAAQEKEQRKRQERVIKLWTKIIQGLRIRDRIEKQYGSNPDATTTVAIPVNESDEEGGFVNEADAHSGLAHLGDHVAPMSLPKMVEFSRIENPLVPPSHQESDEDDLEEIVPLQNGDTATLSSRVGVPLQTPNGTASIGVPKTMSEFAAGRRLEAQAVADEQEDIELQADSDTEPSAPPTPERPTRKTRNASPRKPASRSKMANGTPKRGAKRRRKDSEDEDTLSGSSSDAADFKPASTPVRRTARSKKVIAPVPSSDRVLRTRATRKSMAE